MIYNMHFTAYCESCEFNENYFCILQIMHFQLDFLAVKALMVTCDNDTQLDAPFWCMGGVIMPGVSDCQ